MAHLDAVPAAGALQATPAEDAPERLPPGLGYVASLVMAAVAGVMAHVVRQTLGASNLSLVFVLPVVIAAVSFGWGPALIAALAGVAIFDFFFVVPFYTFQVASPNDLWAMGLLLAVGAIVSAVAGEARRRALAARRAAEQAEALHTLAHGALQGEPRAVLLQTAAASLSRIFAVPAVVLEPKDGKLGVAAATAGADLSGAEHQAAAWALANARPTRAEAYPFDASSYDFWPAPGQGLVLGVRLGGRADGRPQAPEREMEMVAAYLAQAANR